MFILYFCDENTENAEIQKKILKRARAGLRQVRHRWSLTVQCAPMREVNNLIKHLAFEWFEFRTFRVCANISWFFLRRHQTHFACTKKGVACLEKVYCLEM